MFQICPLPFSCIYPADLRSVWCNVSVGDSRGLCGCSVVTSPNRLPQQEAYCFDRVTGTLLFYNVSLCKYFPRLVLDARSVSREHHSTSLCCFNPQTMFNPCVGLLLTLPYTLFQCGFFSGASLVSHVVYSILLAGEVC